MRCLYNGLRLLIFVSFTFYFTFEVALKYVQIYRISEEKRGFTGADKGDAGTIRPLIAHLRLMSQSSFHFYFHKYIQVGATGNILLSNFSGGKSFYKESYWGHHYTIALNCHHWAHGWLVILSQIVSMKKKKQINDNSHSKRKSSWRYQGIMVDNLKLTSKSRNNSPWNLIIHGSCFFFCRKLTK